MDRRMPSRPCGSQGLMSSAQGLGCMGLSGSYLDKEGKGVDDEQGISVIHRCFSTLTFSSPRASAVVERSFAHA